MKATESEIKRSYKKLTKEYHPDKNPENREECVKKKKKKFFFFNLFLFSFLDSWKNTS